MDDNELTALAAKAADIPVEWIEEIGWFARKDAEAFEDGPKWFRPLMDDGDALRLAVKLKLQVLTGQGSRGHITWVRAPDELDIEGPSEHHDADPYAATRRAIVRVAAEIEKRSGEPLED